MITLVKTCEACPEQYDVYLDASRNQQIGYLRLRHGYFAAYLNGPSGPLVYFAYPKGDGIFDPDERDKYLSRAVEAILEQLNIVPYEIVEDLDW